MAEDTATPTPDHPDEDAPRVTDKRRIDPETGELRSPAPEPGDDALSLSDDDLALLAEAERDLVAEYRDRAARAEAELANFRARVERDRQANREAVIIEVIRSLLPALDDLDRAEAHNDLQGTALELVAQKIRQSVQRFGVEKVGAVGDVFDPTVHEAIMRVASADATESTLVDIVEVGYRLGDRVLRPAKAAVSVPDEQSAQ